MDTLVESYWRVVCRTRKSGRISQSVKDKMQEKWKKFDEDVVKEALQIHMNRYKEYSESYTIGIMRNLQKNKIAGVKKKDNWNTGHKQQYDFEALERELRSN